MIKVIVISALALLALGTFTICDLVLGLGLFGSIFGVIVGALGGVVGLVAGAFGVLIGLIVSLLSIGMILALPVLIVAGIVMFFRAA